jgi:hypothetical protein
MALSHLRGFDDDFFSHFRFPSTALAGAAASSDSAYSRGIPLDVKEVSTLQTPLNQNGFGLAAINCLHYYYCGLNMQHTLLFSSPS